MSPKTTLAMTQCDLNINSNISHQISSETQLSVLSTIRPVSRHFEQKHLGRGNFMLSDEKASEKLQQHTDTECTNAVQIVLVT